MQAIAAHVCVAMQVRYTFAAGTAGQQWLHLHLAATSGHGDAPGWPLAVDITSLTEDYVVSDAEALTCAVTGPGLLGAYADATGEHCETR